MTTNCQEIRKCVRPTKINNDYVCKLDVNRQSFDWLQPYNKSDTKSGITGTSFLIHDLNDTDSDFLILVTAYHVVEMGISIRVHIETLSEPRLATVICFNPDLDMALVKVDMSKQEKAELCKTSCGLYLGDSDSLKPLDNVQAIGFALADPLQSTAGVVSGRTTTAIQLDAAVNPGNSGGPVVDDDGNVVGIVVSGIDKAQNVNFAAPINECIDSMQRMLNRVIKGEQEPVFERCASFNAILSHASKSLLKSCSDNCDGCYISYISPTSCLKEAGIQEGDFIHRVSIGGFTSNVDRLARIKLDKLWPTPLSVETLLSRMTAHSEKQPQEAIIYVYPQDGSSLKEKKIKLQENTNNFREINAEQEHVEYILFAGLVFMILTVGHLKKSQTLRTILLPYMIKPEIRQESVIIVSHVHPESPLISMGRVKVGSIITHVNGIPVKKLDDLKKVISEGPKYMKFRLIDSSVCACSIEDANKADFDVKTRLNWKEPVVVKEPVKKSQHHISNLAKGVEKLVSFKSNTRFNKADKSTKDSNQGASITTEKETKSVKKNNNKIETNTEVKTDKPAENNRSDVKKLLSVLKN